MEIVPYFKSCLERDLALLRELVEVESPTADKPAVDTLVSFVSDKLTEVGAKPEVILEPKYGDHIKVRLGASELGGKVLILCHLDTVWGVGEIKKRPFRIDGNKAYGPGILDMKASLLLALLVLKAIHQGYCALKHNLVLLFTSDEEMGSHSSRSLIEKEAEDSNYVLVLEPPLFSNRLKTARKGVGIFELHVSGKAAHAGVDPGSGVNAIEEVAHQVINLSRMNNPGSGTTINVGVISGGTVSNVVPAHAKAAIDVRVSTIEEGNAITQKLLNLKPVNPMAQLKTTGAINRPPLIRTPAVVELFEKARRLASDLGFELGEGATGGGSDGCFTAALGIPTLDGLGVNGSGPHAVDEHIIIDDIPQKAALLTRILETF